MRLTPLDRTPVEYVIRNAHDLAEVQALHGHSDVGRLVDAVMGTASFAWLVWDDNTPAAVFGAQASPIPGVWTTFLLATPQFKAVALPLTRFIRRAVIPVLFRDLDVRRVQADLHADHRFVHRWVELLGAKKEGEMRELAPGAAYFRYALCRTDWVDKSDNTCYSDVDGRTSRRSSLSPVPDTSESHVRPDALPG